jgi:Ferritin-like
MKQVAALMRVPRDQRDLAWLKTSLQAAIELEFATIPPYLCALWSIKDQSGEVYDRIDSIVLQEMLHMGLACNMLTTIGGSPSINSPGSVPKYPGPLPGGVRPQLTVGLEGLNKRVVSDVFMQIEYPEGGPVALILGRTYPTIGAFYQAVLEAFRQLPPGSITGSRQLTAGGVGLTKVTTLAEAERAILEIREQGEGTAQSPLAEDFGGDFAHYYKFAEIYHEQKLIRLPDGSWDYKGAPLPFPEVFPMAAVPAGGYPESLEFDRLFIAMLGRLQQAWSDGDAAELTGAIRAMSSLGEVARSLMQKPRSDGAGNLGPCFRLV